MAGKKQPVRKQSAVKRRRQRPAPPSPVAPVAAATKPGRPQAPFHIVAIGCSAGGVEALEEFFRHLPECPDAAFVVLSHQSPNHRSLLPELLRRWTTLSVNEAVDGMAIEHNRVYLSSPGSLLAVMHAVLHLMETGDKARHVLPIDYFFLSLAEDQQDKAIGIILSGTGTDGSLGIKAIKAESGVTMAQEPQSAKYAGMPQHAIATGAVDFVRPASELGPQLCEFLRHRTLAPRGPVLDDEGKRNLNKIVLYLRDRTGNDFSLYKDNTTLRRVERRMNIHQIDTLPHYLRYVQTDPSEAEALFHELLIGVTSFFRDPAIFDVLASQGIPQLLGSKPDGYTVRAWVPACSTGEEVYSLAILLQEYIIEHKRRLTIQVFGTDIDKDAIDKARQGLYPEGIAMQVSAARLQEFFVKEDSHYRVKSEIRDRITFAPHNLLKDPPFTKVDLLLCRNFLIYLRPETQQWLIPLFHYALKPNGLLLLGNAESVDGFTNLFSTLHRQHRIFIRAAGPGSLALPEKRRTQVGTVIDRPVPPIPKVHRPSYLVESIHTLLLDRYVPPGVFVNRQGQVVYIHGRTGDYLEPAQGPASQQVVEMTRPGLRRDLIAALRLAEKQGGTVVRKGIRLPVRNKEMRVTLSVTPLYKPEALEGLLLVVFENESVRTSRRPVALRHEPLSKEEKEIVLELEYTQQRLQRANEDLQLSNEEFKSANEEFQSTNEELQSTNEELETTREELQSLNEELVTVNSQLQSKLGELSNVNDDLQNLVNSTEIATVFLDKELRIKRFTPEAARISRVIESDVGRPFSDIVSTIRYDDLMKDARQVLDTLVPTEREVEAMDGRWYSLRMVPYRTSSDVIDGLVLIFIDISSMRQASESIRRAQLYAESIVDTVREPLLVLNADLRVVTANRAFYRHFGVEAALVERHPLAQILHGGLNQPALRTALVNALADEKLFDDIEIELKTPSGPARWMANARCFHPAADGGKLLLLALEKITDTGTIDLTTQK